MKRSSLVAIFLCFAVISAIAQVPSTDHLQKKVAITIDDVPGVLTNGGEARLQRLKRNTEKLLAGLKAHKVPAIGFVNEAQLQVPGEMDARADVLEQWLTAGMTLGNHTFSHPSLTRSALHEYEDDFVRGDIVTRRLMRAHGQTPKYFRYPFNHAGPTKEIRDAFLKFIAERGYQPAPFTFDSADYMFNFVYEPALDKGDAADAQRIAQAHLDTLRTNMDYAERRSRELFGRDIAHVFIMHANTMNAATIDALLKTFEDRGYKFVSLEEALSDPAYQTQDAYAGPAGISWLHRWAPSVGKESDVRNEPDPPKWLVERYESAHKARAEQRAAAAKSTAK